MFIIEDRVLREHPLMTLFGRQIQHVSRCWGTLRAVVVIAVRVAHRVMGARHIVLNLFIPIFLESTIEVFFLCLHTARRQMELPLEP